MIEWISNWAEAIIIAVMISAIIEMILPEGSSKKYVKVVIGVYILFTIVSPIISKLTGKSLKVSEMIDFNQYMDTVKEKEMTQNVLQEENAASIREIYMGNLKADIQNKLKGKGYVVNRVNLDVGYDDNYTLYKIELNVTKEKEEENIENTNTSNVQTVNEINVNISEEISQSNTTNEEKQNSKLTNADKKKIREYLSSVYEMNEKNIVFD